MSLQQHQQQQRRQQLHQMGPANGGWLSSGSNLPDNRRMSEPCRGGSDRSTPPPPRPHSVVLPPITRAQDHHPNQEVVLDEVAEGEMVEKNLVIPDEMLHFLNQVIRTHPNLSRGTVFAMSSHILLSFGGQEICDH